MGMPIAMIPEAAALYRLMAWLSPAYPVGAYSYSHGLEWAVEAGLVRDRAGLLDWLGTVLRHGGGRLDAVLLAHGYSFAAAGDLAAWQTLRRQAWAMAASAELALETRAQGEAFARATLACWPDPAGRMAALLGAGEEAPAPVYPLAVAAAAACHGVPRDPTLLAYLQAFAANLVSAAVRLVPLGQTDGQRAIAALAPMTAEVASIAAATPLDALGTATPMVDWCAMRHETQYTRLFRS
jgi:urease accessory protein